LPQSGLPRILLLAAILIFALFIGSLLARTGPLFPSPFQIAVTTPTATLPTSTKPPAATPSLNAETTPTADLPISTSESALTICEPDDQTSACLLVDWDTSQNLAALGNDTAQPAVAKDAQSDHPASYVNDGRSDTNWVGTSAESWIKIDLGQVSPINLVTLETGNLGSAPSNNLGHFVISVAVSDVYEDGDDSNDDQDYEPVFHSEQAGFSGTVSNTAMISARFTPVEARFVKVTFEQADANIEEIGIFMVELPVLVQQPTKTPQGELPGTPQGTLIPTLTAPTQTSTSVSTAVPTTAEPSQTPAITPQPSNTSPPQPTDTQPPADTATTLPTQALPTQDHPTAIQTTKTLSSGSP
jgi:hypothetical protein